MKLMLVLSILLSFHFASAHGSKSELVLAATVTAVDSFENEEPKEVVMAFNGLKSWVSGATIKVKLYYNSNENSISFDCEMVHSDGGSEEMVCTRKP